MASFERLEQRQVLATDVNVSVGLGITQIDSSVHGSDERIVKQGDGTLVLSAANTHTGGVVVSSGTLVVRNVAALGSGPVVVQAGAKLVLDDGSGTVDATSLVLQQGGLIDVGSSKLSIHTGFTQEMLISAIQSAKGDGSWNGESGIGSSVVRSLSEDGTPRTLGWLTWVANDDSSYTVGFAAAGDTNLDGFVDVIDLSNIFNGPNLDPGLTATWEAGDFNHDGIVDTLDLSDLMVTNLFDAGNYLPPEPPSVPTDLVATATSSSTATLTWASEDSPVGFEIEQSSDGVSGWQPVTLVSLTDAGNGNTSAIVGGLVPGTETHFRVRSYNDSPSWWWDDRYRSADSPTASAMTTPAAPETVTARGVTPTQIAVSWTPGPGGRTGYVVERQVAGQTTWTTLGQTSGTARHFVDGTVTVGESYVYRVAANYGTNASDAVSPVAGAISPPVSPPDATTDFDADGLPDLMELNIGTNPDAQDTDGDTLLDAYEYGTANNLLDPIIPNDANGDADSDGVPNAIEQAAVSDAGLPDTDSDGIVDFEEIQQGSDPADASDGGQRPTQGPGWQDWRKHVDFTTVTRAPARDYAEQVKESRWVLLPKSVSLPAILRVSWSVDDNLAVDGKRLGTGLAGTGATTIRVTQRWLRTDLIDTVGVNWGGSADFSLLPNYAIDIKVAAFIPLSNGIDPAWDRDPSEPWSSLNWAPEPITPYGGMFWPYFATDDRNDAGEAGTSRLHSLGRIDFRDIGAFEQMPGDIFRTDTDNSYQVQMIGNIYALADTIKTGKANPSYSEVRRDGSTDKSAVVIAAEASYPFSPIPFVNLNPAINYDIAFTFERLENGATTIRFNGWHDSFPAYEIIINGTVIYSHEVAADEGPTISNLGGFNTTSASGEFTILPWND